jgi:hypothetical protein
MTDILNLIHQITANGESGRLEILAGATQGELSFANGKLVDARLGQLTGFRAINAVAAMRDTRFSFDPAFAPLGSSSITASERVVLKQFFGIETAATSEYLEPAVANVPDEVDEVTIVKTDVPSAGIPTPPPPHTSRFSYRTALTFAVLVMAVMAAVAIYIDRLPEPGSSKVVTSVESPSGPAPIDAARELSGKWTIVNTVETTSYRSFKNMKFGFDLSIDQTGSTFTGKGRKVSENGRSLPANSRTPIQVQGSINGDRIEATFIEEGTARKSNGRFVWRLDKSGRGLTGNFATTAARSSGKSAAIRM